MKLYHVSRNNKNKPEIDMSQTLKNDMCYIHFLIDVMKSFNEFYKMYNSPLAEQYSKERGWSKEKIATEAIFEYVRFTEYETNPSRMIYMIQLKRQRHLMRTSEKMMVIIFLLKRM